MLRFLRILFGLMLTITTCIALSKIANQSADIWGCLRYPNETNAGSVLVDVQTGTYHIEPPFAPVSYLNNALRWFPNATGDSVLYYSYNATGLYRIGVIDNTYTHRSIDNQYK